MPTFDSILNYSYALANLNFGGGSIARVMKYTIRSAVDIEYLTNWPKFLLYSYEEVFVDKLLKFFLDTRC